MCGTVPSSPANDTDYRTRADGVQYLTLEASPGFETSWPDPWLLWSRSVQASGSLNGPDLCPQNQVGGRLFLPYLDADI